MRFYLPYDVAGGKNLIAYSRFTIQDALKGKKVTSLYLGAILKHDSNLLPGDNPELNIVREELRRLKFSKDTSRVIKVILNNDCNYGTFLWLLNEALIYDFRRYSYLADTVFFFPNRTWEYSMHQTENRLRPL